MIGVLNVVLKLREKVALKAAKKLQHGEAVTHLLYGIAVFTETHGVVTFYSASALCLGVTAVVVSLVGGE